jgi:nifR3 family TIM-barrel protein
MYPENAVFLAPLAGYTDPPFRRSARRHGNRFAFTEMIDAGSLVYGTDKTLRFLHRDADEPWLGVQMVGAEPDILARATDLLNEHRFAVLDFNLGCPSPKVVRKGEGAVLGEDRPRAVAAFRAMATHAAMPVTAKIRILDAVDPSPTVALAEALVEAGAVAITIHGRLRRAVYSGPVAMDIIAAVRERLSVPVIANGGVHDATTACELRNGTGCSRIMVARGALGNPWLFEELADPAGFRPPTLAKFADELETHLRDMMACYGVEFGLMIARKLVLDYLKGRGFPGELRNSVSHLATAAECEALMARIRSNHSPRYWQWLEANPAAPRRLSP